MSPDTSRPRRLRRAALAALIVPAAALGSFAPSTLAADAPVLDLERLSSLQAQRMMDEGELTSVQLTQAYINRINALNKRGPGLNAVTQFNPQALVEAAASDARRKAGQPLGPADGLPILMKDLVDVKGMYTSAGNFSLRNSYPANDSGIARNIRKAGGVILGKLGLTEYANHFGRQPQGFGNLTGQVLNGLDTDATPVGSSSGSGTASAVALSSMVVGTETSGSNIAPAVTQGTVAIRPTVGLVPGIGVGPIAASQDTAGPSDKSVEDTAVTLQAISGYDEADALSHAGIWGPGVDADYIVPAVPQPTPDYVSALDLDFVEGKRIGYNGDIAAGTPMRAAYDALVTAGAIMVERPIVAPVGLPAGSVLAWEGHRDLDRYYANLGPDAPIKSLEEEIADNRANAHEALKFGNVNHATDEVIDISPNSAASVLYRADLVQGKIAARGAIDAMLQNATPADLSDDFIAILGRVVAGTDQYGHSLGSRAGYPQMTIPMGYEPLKRAPLNVLLHGTKYSERDLIGVGYVIEQATKRHKTASELSPSLYRCAKTVPLPPHADRGSCNPGYDTIMAATGTRPNLGFSLETESIKSLNERLLAGTLTSEELTKAYLARIALTNAEGPATQAVRSVDLNALAQAKALDEERRTRGPRGPLHGIPVLISESIDVGGAPTTAGSIALQNSMPAADSKLVARLRAAGAIILGKTNVGELNGVFDANMPEGYSSLGGQVLLASDTDKTPAGSSAGAAAATATGLAAATIGLETSTDTAQLIAPAAVAGVVGLKPTVGRISRTGVLGVAKSQDAPGPITRTVYDAATQLQVMAVRDSSDPATAGAPTAPEYVGALKTNALRGKRIATVTSTDLSYGEAITAVQDLGATTTVKTVPAPSPNPPSIVTREFKRDVNGYLSNVSGGAASLAEIIAYNGAHADEALRFQQRDLVAADAIDLADGATAAAYESDRDTGRTSSQALIDTILTNATPETTDDFQVVMVPNGNALVGLADRAGYPVLTVPAGYGIDQAGRNPVGVTFIATAFDEADLLAAGYAFEQKTQVRLAPSHTNPSMWRCVPGSTFFKPYQCHPGDRMYTMAFTPVAQPETPDTPPAVQAPPSAVTPTPVATKPARLRTVRLSASAVRLDRLGRIAIKVTCVPGPTNCRVRVSVKRNAVSLGARTVTIRPGKSVTIHLRPTAAMRRSLARGRSVTVRASVSGTGIKAVKATTIKVLPRR